MESGQFAELKELSAGVFNNGTILPVAWAVPRIAKPGQTIQATAIREELGGRLEGNQIRDALTRLEAGGAVREMLPHPGPPHPRVWERLDTPFWALLDGWLAHETSLESSAEGQI
jgi:hypothetical protein